MIIAGLEHSTAARAMLGRAGIPIVEIMDIDGDPINHAVGISHRRAGRQMAEAIIAAGYRKIAFLGTQMPNDFRAKKRLEGFEEALGQSRSDAGRPRILLRRLGPSEGPRDDGGGPEPHPGRGFSLLFQRHDRGRGPSLVPRPGPRCPRSHRPCRLQRGRAAGWSAPQAGDDGRLPVGDRQEGRQADRRSTGRGEGGRTVPDVAAGGYDPPGLKAYALIEASAAARSVSVKSSRCKA